MKVQSGRANQSAGIVDGALDMRNSIARDVQTIQGFTGYTTNDAKPNATIMVSLQGNGPHYQSRRAMTDIISSHKDEFKVKVSF